MSSSYFATFPAGCYEIIARQLKGFSPAELKITGHDDSSVEFVASLNRERLIELRFFTNIYVVADADLPRDMFRGRYFSLAMLKGGQPIPLAGGERARLEDQIQRDFQLVAGTHQSLNDFYLIERRSGGPRLLALKLARAKFKREELAAGELRPELAHILCLVAGLKPKDRLLEVFAGHGALALEAVRGFGVKQIIAVDSQQLPGRHEHSAITWQTADARDLGALPDGSFDRVLADPPWGSHEQMLPAEQQRLYVQSLSEIHRVVKPGGIVVILSGNALLSEAAQGKPGLELIKSYSILVSGKKAQILKLQKSQTATSA